MIKQAFVDLISRCSSVAGKKIVDFGKKPEKKYGFNVYNASIACEWNNVGRCQQHGLTNIENEPKWATPPFFIQFVPRRIYREIGKWGNSIDDNMTK